MDSTLHAAATLGSASRVIPGAERSKRLSVYDATARVLAPPNTFCIVLETRLLI
jgi:hypothetical protein